MYNFFLEHVKCYHLRSTFDYHEEVGQIIKNIKQVNIIYMKNTERVSIGKYTLSVLNPKNLVTTKKFTFTHNYKQVIILKRLKPHTKVSFWAGAVLFPKCVW